MTTTATITEIASVNASASKTSGTTSYSISTGASALQANDLIIVTHCSSGTSITHNAPTWSYGTFTALTSQVAQGTLITSVWYCFATGAVPASTTITMTQSGTSTAVGYTIVGFRGAQAIGNTVTYVGTTTNLISNYYATAYPLGAGQTAFSAQGSYWVSSVGFNGANLSLYQIDLETKKETTGGSFNAVGNVTATALPTTAWYPWTGDANTDTYVTSPLSALGTAWQVTASATRNYAGMMFSVSPSSYTPIGQPITELAADTDTGNTVTDAPNGQAVVTTAADTAAGQTITDALNGQALVATVADTTNGDVSTDTLQGQPITMTQDGPPGVAAPTAAPTGSPIITSLALVGIGIGVQVGKPGIVHGKIITATVAGGTKVASVAGRTLASSVAGSWEVQP